MNAPTHNTICKLTSVDSMVVLSLWCAATTAHAGGCALEDPMWAFAYCKK